jgi:HEAT repeat protein
LGRGAVVSPEQRSLVMALVMVPGGREPLATDEFLQHFNATDGAVLGLDLLRDAIDRHDPVDVELALVVCFKFGFSHDHLEPLITLAFADWHQRHEDVAMALGRLRVPSSAAALMHLAQWVPSYLEFDEARALAVKAIWALGSIGGEEAHQALESLSQSESKVVAENALAQLQK